MKDENNISSKESKIFIYRFYHYTKKMNDLGVSVIHYSHIPPEGFTPEKIIRPPGDKFFEVLKFLYTKKVFERVFEPMIADMQEEYFEAMSKKNIWKMRWIHLRGVISLLIAVVYNPVVSLVKKFLVF